MFLRLKKNFFPHVNFQTLHRMHLRGTLFQILAADAAKDRLLSDSLTLKFEIDSIITSTPCSSVVSIITNY